MAYNLITVLGPTATGKTALAAALAARLNGEVISADSRQVYRGLNIGAGKDLDEFFVNGTFVPYHLIDICSSEEEFDLYHFTIGFRQAFKQIHEQGKLPILAGGTGLYLSSVLEQYRLHSADFRSPRGSELEKKTDEQLRSLLLSLRPHQHNTTDIIDRNRLIRAVLVAEAESKKTDSVPPAIHSCTLGINPGREEVKRRISERLHRRLGEGMIEEVETLMKDGVPFEKMIFWGLEYKFIALFLKGELTKEEMTEKLEQAIHRFAKRQMTWFRRMEKHGVKIHWLERGEVENALRHLAVQGKTAE